MQTFLPHPDFRESARALDRARLGKQRVEALQLLRALLSPGTSRWENHPAARMWRGHERSLAEYGDAVCAEWTSRGYRDTCREKMAELARGLPDAGPPAWLGDERVHSTHRSNLLRKAPEHYGREGWTEPDDLPYFWPA